MDKGTMRAVNLFLFALFLPAVAMGIAWSTIDRNEILEDARFVGTAIIQKGDAVSTTANSQDVCSVRYTAQVTGSVVGPPPGSSISLLVLKDYRDDMRLGFLEVGSEYFVFAGDRDSHGFIQITDVLYGRDDELPDRCHSDDRFYVFQEFSGRLEYHDGDKVLRNHYIRQIDGVAELKSYYYSEENYDYLLEATAKTLHEQLVENLGFVGIPASSLLEFFGDVGSPGE